MKYQIRNSKETETVELKYTDIDGQVDKTKLHIYENGSDEELLKLIKEFKNYVDTYDIWNARNQNAAHTVYKIFCQCLAGAARDRWDLINVIDEDEVRDDITFQFHIHEFTTAILGNDAFRNQKDYLKSTPKRNNMSVKQWINRLLNINSYLPLMQRNARAFLEEDLISEVISRNIPAVWMKDFELSKLHLQTEISEIMTDLTIIEAQVKVQPKQSDKTHQNNKNLRNPCRLHHGSHEWDECCQNPKNQKTDDRNTTNNNNRNNRRPDGNNRSREEHRRNEGGGRPSSQERSRHRSPSSGDSEHEFHNINDASTVAMSTTPSSELLIAIPTKKGSKSYTTYLGLVDSGASGSLVNKELIECTDFKMTLQRKPIKWDTATGVFKTNGTVTIENYCLPKFTKKRHITTSFHMFYKRDKDRYDFSLGRDLLTSLGLDIHYSTSQFSWDDILVDMVPSGYWTKAKIAATAKTWNTPNKSKSIKEEGKSEELRLTEIISADYNQ